MSNVEHRISKFGFRHWTFDILAVAATAHACRERSGETFLKQRMIGYNNAKPAPTSQRAWSFLDPARSLAARRACARDRRRRKPREHGRVAAPACTTRASPVPGPAPPPLPARPVDVKTRVRPSRRRRASSMAIRRAGRHPDVVATQTAGPS